MAASTPDRDQIRQALAKTLKDTVDEYAGNLRELRKRELRQAEKRLRKAGGLSASNIRGGTPQGRRPASPFSLVDQSSQGLEGNHGTLGNLADGGSVAHGDYRGQPIPLTVRTAGKHGVPPENMPGSPSDLRSNISNTDLSGKQTMTFGQKPNTPKLRGSPPTGMSSSQHVQVGGYHADEAAKHAPGSPEHTFHTQSAAHHIMQAKAKAPGPGPAFGKSESCPLCGQIDQPGVCTCVDSRLAKGDANSYDPSHAKQKYHEQEAEKHPLGDPLDTYHEHEADKHRKKRLGKNGIGDQQGAPGMALAEMCMTHGKDLSKCGPKCAEEMKKDEFISKAWRGKAKKGEGGWDKGTKAPPAAGKVVKSPEGKVKTAKAELHTLNEPGDGIPVKLQPTSHRHDNKPGPRVHDRNFDHSVNSGLEEPGHDHNTIKSEAPLRKDVKTRTSQASPNHQSAYQVARDKGKGPGGGLPGLTAPGNRPAESGGRNISGKGIDSEFDDEKTPKPTRSRRKNYAVQPSSKDPTSMPASIPGRGLTPPANQATVRGLVSQGMQAAAGARPVNAAQTSNVRNLVSQGMQAAQRPKTSIPLPTLEPAPTPASQANAEMANFKPIATSPTAMPGARPGTGPTDAQNLAEDKKAGGVGWLNSIVSKLKGAGNKTWDSLRGAGPSSQARLGRTMGSRMAMAEKLAGVQLMKSELGQCVFCDQSEHAGDCT